MTSIGMSSGGLRTREATRVAATPADSLQLDRWMALLCCLITFGLFIDGWAHNHGQVDDSFFTPWHALLYGAVVLSGLTLIITHMRNASKGFRFGSALPAGYSLSLLGFFMFAAGGLADLLWHETFGFEEGIEALVSPSHLFLAVAGLLILTGPIRAAWQRKGGSAWSELLPAILAFTCITAVFLFFTSFAAITSDTRLLTGVKPVNTRYLDAVAIVAFILHSNILLGVMLVMARRWTLPFGAATLLFGATAALMTWLRIERNEEFIFVIAAVAAGLLADWLLRRGCLSTTKSARLFCMLLPFSYCLGALGIIQLLGSAVWGGSGMWWLIHMWLGVPALAAAFGYGLSLLMRPPTAPAR